MTVEVIVQAIQLAILVIKYALEEAAKHEAAKLDAERRRTIFDAAVDRARGDILGRAEQQKAQIDAQLDAVDKVLMDSEKTPPGGTFPPHT